MDCWKESMLGGAPIGEFGWFDLVRIGWNQEQEHEHDQEQDEDGHSEGLKDEG